MKKWLFRALWIPALAVAVLFLVANRQPVVISLDPINADAPALTSFPAPLWAWLMVMLFVGLGAGALGAWLSARPGRVEGRANRKLVSQLRKDVTRLETKLREAEAKREIGRETGTETKSGSVPAAEPPLLESEDA